MQVKSKFCASILDPCARSRARPQRLLLAFALALAHAALTGTISQAFQVVSDHRRYHPQMPAEIWNRGTPSTASHIAHRTPHVASMASTASRPRCVQLSRPGWCFKIPRFFAPHLSAPRRMTSDDSATLPSAWERLTDPAGWTIGWLPAELAAHLAALAGIAPVRLNVRPATPFRGLFRCRSGRICRSIRTLHVLHYWQPPLVVGREE